MIPVYLNKVSVSTSSAGSFQATILARQAAQTGLKQVTTSTASIIQPMIQELSLLVNNYIGEFESAVNKYKADNNLLKAMSNVLDPNGHQSDTVIISSKKLNNRKQSTKNMILTMAKGHSLLLQMREALTGQKIATKFYVETDDGLYSIGEEQMQLGLVLSKFGGDTASNPFSLAYGLDAGLRSQTKELAKSGEFENLKQSNLYDQIMKLKRPYLDEKTKKTGREYSHIFFDSKDAEIMELYSQLADTETGAAPLTIELYASYRASMGGGGGYASPFFKIGDIGLTQVKFFSMKNSRKNIAINFARFSLLRDRFRELAKILNQTDERDIINDLSAFFTEKESNLSDSVSKAINKQAQELFEKYLTLK